MGASKFPCIQSDRIRIFSPPHSALGPFYVPLNWDLRPQGAGHSPKQCTASILTSIPSFPATKRCFHCPGSPPQASRALWGMGECSSSSYDRARWLYSRSLSDHSELNTDLAYRALSMNRTLEQVLPTMYVKMITNTAPQLRDPPRSYASRATPVHFLTWL